MSDVSCERRQAAICTCVSVSFVLEPDCDDLLVHCVDGDQDCDRGCVVLGVQETVVALDDWCTGLDL